MPQLRDVRSARTTLQGRRYRRGVSMMAQHVLINRTRSPHAPSPSVQQAFCHERVVKSYRFVYFVYSNEHWFRTRGASVRRTTIPPHRAPRHDAVFKKSWSGRIIFAKKQRLSAPRENVPANYEISVTLKRYQWSTYSACRRSSSRRRSSKAAAVCAGSPLTPSSIWRRVVASPTLGRLNTLTFG